MFIALNAIIMSPEYIGMFDDDPRIPELAKRLMELTPSFGEDVRSALRQAAETGRFSDMEAALDKLYDYADQANIDLGKADGTPLNPN